ncbi:MAG: NAD(P)H-quinone oxidoreductase [Vicinamibacterales bacterium]
MRAVEISRPGGPEVLRVVERPTPVPGDGEVRIRVRAAGLNRPDVMQREGRYPPPPGASDLPGLEVAGLVDALGPGVEAWSPGDAVCALVPGGGYAEYCLAPAGHCLTVPFPLDTGGRGAADDPFVRAAALPETSFTVWANVFERGRLVAGDTLLVHGGASGIGTTAIQLAVARGATVLATAGDDAKCRACERLGAVRGVNYRNEDFVDAVKAATDGRGVDVILDIVGGEYLDRNLRALAVDGRLVQIGVQGGPKATIDLSRVLTRRLTITGSTLRPRSVEEKAAIAAGLRREVWPLVEAGRVAPVIDSVFALEQVADAHRRLESGGHIGKVMLTL